MFDFGGILSSRPVVFSGIFLGIAVAILYILSIYWVYRDVFGRTKNVTQQIAAIVVTVLFPFIGMLMYLLIRPPMTLEERRIQLLEEKILRAEFDKVMKEHGGRPSPDRRPSIDEKRSHESV